MRLKDLQSLLQDCRPFEEPKVELEQYTTRPHIAAHILHAIDNSFEGFSDTTVVDLGCGAVSPESLLSLPAPVPSRFPCAPLSRASPSRSAADRNPALHHVPW